VAEEIVRNWRRPDAPIVQLVGPDDTGKRLIAAHAASAGGLVACRLPVSLLPTEPTELDHLARLWERESTLLPLMLYLDTEDADAGQAKPGRFLARTGGRSLFACRESWPDLGRGSLVLDVAPPTPAERADAWYAVYGRGPDADALAAQFGLELPAIREAAAVADGDPAEAWRACRVRTRPRLDALAQRLETKVTWADIVLPEDGRQVLEQIANQVAHRTTVYETWGFADRVTRGLGLSALFAGPSGAGKTMAAEVLANHLRLDLYRIDLSAVVSKYIGETEKNLRRLFDAAEGGGSILFFDEADSLFGKRSEVKDSHDRYANIEVNYLLQRMEAYRGLAVLATNLRSALDSAFLRRLRFIVEFEFPGVSQRKAIWEKALPPTAPRAELDYDRLARLQTSGGMIRNIALNAAFLAVSANTSITMPHLLAAARTEFQKLELPMPERDFAWEGAQA
jgi:SpoVK/Ycf46/Vps4 family AAA+-type ATPase